MTIPISHLRKLLAEATPGVRVMERNHPQIQVGSVLGGNGDVVGGIWQAVINGADGELCCAAVNYLPEILDRLEKLEKVAKVAEMAYDFVDPHALSNEWHLKPVAECYINTLLRNALDEAGQ